MDVLEKLSFNLRLLFHQATDETILTEPAVDINTSTKELFAADDLEDLLSLAFEELQKRIDKFESKGSGWAIHKLLQLNVHIDQLDPLRASSYIPTPQYIAAKKAVVNVKNNDNACFMWTYLAAVHNNDASKNPSRLQQYKKYQSELNMRGIEMPMKLNEIPKYG